MILLDVLSDEEIREAIQNGIATGIRAASSTHVGPRGVHVGHGGGSKIGGVVVSSDAHELVSSIDPNLLKAAKDSGLKEIRMVSTKEMASLAGKDRGGAQTGGLYEDNGRLSIVRGMSPEITKGTLHHEMAHAMDPLGKDGRYKNSQSKEWLEAGNWKEGQKGKLTRKDTMDDKPTSQYGKTAPWEDFAESYKMMLTGDKYDRRAMQAESSKRYTYMKKFLSGKGVEIND